MDSQPGRRSPTPSRLSRITDWPERAGAANYRVNKLAASCDVSSRQLQRFVQETLGLTPRKWMRDLRQKRALALLSDATSVKRVALDLGYSQTCHFSRDFKNAFGVPPSQARHASLASMSD